MLQKYLFALFLLTKINIQICYPNKPLYHEDADKLAAPTSNYYVDFPEIFFTPIKAKREVNSLESNTLAEVSTETIENMKRKIDLKAATTTRSPILQALQNGTDSLNKTMSQAWSNLTKDPTKFFETLLQNAKEGSGESPKLILRGSSTYIAPMPNMLDGIKMFMNFMQLMRPQSG